MSHMQLTKIYGNVCSIQNYNHLIAALPQTWRQLERGEAKEIACLQFIKDQNCLKKIVINKKVYPFHLIQNSCNQYSVIPALQILL